MEDRGSLNGLRLFLKKSGEDDNEELVSMMTRRNLSPEEDAAAGPKHIVYFRLEKALSLVGGNAVDMDIL